MCQVLCGDRTVIQARDDSCSCGPVYAFSTEAILPQRGTNWFLGGEKTLLILCIKQIVYIVMQYMQLYTYMCIHIHI